MENKIIHIKNNIISILNVSKFPLNTEEIFKSLKNEYTEDKKWLLLALEELVKNEIIFLDSNKFYLRKKNFYNIGKISINKVKGFGFIRYNENEESLYVHNKNLNGALHNDEVLFVITEFYNKFTNKKSIEAKVLKVLKRNNNVIIGIIKKNRFKQNYLIIKNPNLLNINATIQNQDIGVEGNVVSAELIKVINKNNVAIPIVYVKVIKVLGHINDPGVDILAIVNEFKLPYAFNSDVYEEANKISTTISNYDVNNLKNRTNLVDELLVTIDGVTAKDLDDAIRVKKLENGNYSLLVAIADVSHYVKKDSAIDLSALERGASAYLIDRVIPMLPERLSNGICSLSENEYRFCMAMETEIDNKGQTVKSKIFQGLMKSKARLTYDDVNKLYNKEDHNIKFEIQKMLFDAKNLYEILSKLKQKNGMINLDIKEPEFILDDKGKVIDIKTRDRFVAEKLIESFMIKANEVVAETIYRKKLPFIYRIHPKPKEEKLRNLWNFLTLLGINTKEFMNSSIDAKTFQKIITKLETYDNNQLTLNIFLRSMEKAVYSQKNEGHFGLVSKCYTHFTSPIRRYPDLLVHRLLKIYIIFNDRSKEVINYYNKHIQEIADQSTANEIKIVDCEREVHKMKKAEYVSQFIGQEFSGIISGVTNFGFFVSLDNTVEGMVHISDLDDDYYIFDEKTFKLVGEKTKKVYSLGTKINIIVKNANKETRNIDFIIAK